MKDKRKLWNRKQKLLRGALAGSQDLEAGIDLFLEQHATPRKSHRPTCLLSQTSCGATQGRT